MTKATEDRSRTHKHEAKFGLARQTDIWHFPTSEDLNFHLKKKKKCEFQLCVAFFFFFKKSPLCWHTATSSSSAGHQCWVLLTQVSCCRNQMNTVSYQPHTPYLQWREVVEERVESAPRMGHRREPVPGPWPQRAAPASLPHLVCWLHWSLWCWWAATDSLSSASKRWEHLWKNNLEKNF